MNKTITLTYSVPLLRQAVFSFCRKTVGAGFIVALALLMVACVALTVSGGSLWLAGFFTAALFLGLAFPVLLYVVHYRNAIAKLNDMGVPQATLGLRDDGFTLTSSAGASSFPWASIKDVWQCEHFWLVFFSKAQFWTLPLAALDSEDKAFIIARVTAAGGKISAA